MSSEGSRPKPSSCAPCPHSACASRHAASSATVGETSSSTFRTLLAATRTVCEAAHRNSRRASPRLLPSRSREVMSGAGRSIAGATSPCLDSLYRATRDGASVITSLSAVASNIETDTLRSRSHGLASIRREGGCPLSPPAGAAPRWAPRWMTEEAEAAIVSTRTCPRGSVPAAQLRLRRRRSSRAPSRQTRPTCLRPARKAAPPRPGSRGQHG